MVAAWLADPAIGCWFPGAQPADLVRFLTFVIETGIPGPVGLLAFSHIGVEHSAELCCVMIGDPSARRRGLASQAIRTAMQQCLPAGIDRVVLRVSVENHAARRLYARLGFTVGARLGTEVVLVNRRAP